ncbi:hypothetical protein DEU56DRAFT_785823 [Suillus clintonianus]|uniref:uncharacterized protein n=1 Tax=Suillus clintonianus TaxID=1904413 RepID=UPI001B878482|nr:uncharacterized protein DEU56DRAFT_785823 [Suillus clintonianus]KAG2146675.1 hypothetical protein DEU56DRAFT_785823 [Suillus clintonianus]
MWKRFSLCWMYIQPCITLENPRNQRKAPWGDSRVLRCARPHCSFVLDSLLFPYQSVILDVLFRSLNLLATDPLRRCLGA